MSLSKVKFLGLLAETAILAKTASMVETALTASMAKMAKTDVTESTDAKASQVLESFMASDVLLHL